MNRLDGIQKCHICRYYMSSPHEEPCADCIEIVKTQKQNMRNFVPAVDFGEGESARADKVPEQPTKPPMPKVFPPKEEPDHPEYYSCGKNECIDAMVEKFGVDAVILFCEMNAFQYLWRDSRKNGIENTENALWYLNKLVELEDRAEQCLQCDKRFHRQKKESEDNAKGL